MTLGLAPHFQRGLGFAAFLQFFFCVLLAVAVPKATTVSLAILLCGSLFLFIVHRADRSVMLGSSRTKWFWVIFLPLFVAGSSLWTEQGSVEAYQAAATVGFTLLAYVYIVDGTSVVSHSVQRGCYVGFLVGISVAASVSALDLISDQALSRWVFTTWPQLDEANTRHVVFEGGQAVYVSEATTNRRAVVLACLLPAFGYCLVKSRGSWALMAFSFLGAIAYAAHTVFTYSLTTQLACVAGVSIIVAALFAPSRTLTALRLGWIAAWVMMVPVTIGLAEIGLHEAKWLPFSSTQRVRIWAGVAEEVVQRPIFGHGVGAKAEYLPVRSTTNSQVEAAQKKEVYHPHNGYLQVWHELGILGAILFGGFGLWILQKINTLRGEIKPYFLGLFANAAFVSMTGYGFWQHWHLSAFALGAGVLWALSHRRPDPRKTSW